MSFVNKKIIDFETTYNTKNKTHNFNEWPIEMIDFLHAVLQENWLKVNQLFEPAFHLIKQSDEKAFVLQWAVAACDFRGDLKSRERLLLKWEEIPEWQNNYYCRFVHTFHEGMSFFIKGHLREAEARFSLLLEIATAYNYQNGIIRSLFHMGLVYRDFENKHKSLNMFNTALKLAITVGAVRYIERIEIQISRLNNLDAKVENTKAALFQKFHKDIEKSILQNKFQIARTQLIQAELFRRKSGLTRKAQSFYIYLPIICAKRGQLELSKRLFQKISDPILKIKAYDLKYKSIGLNESEKQTWKFLREIHGLSTSVLNSSAGLQFVEICGVKLDKITDTDVRNLMELFLNTKDAINKNDICEKIWNFNYDPVIHDSKIYKLIHRARSLFGKPDLIVNTYGGYKLNAS